MQSRQLLPWNWFKKENERELPSGSRDVMPQSTSLHLQPLMRIQQQMDKLVEDLWGQDEGMLRSGFFTPDQRAVADAVLRPNLDISENDEGYRIQVEVPGVAQEDLNVSLENDVLTISGEKSQTHEDKSDNYHRVERAFGCFERVLCLPANADKEHMNATFKDGVLTIAFAKQSVPEGQSPKRVEISAG